MPQSDRRIFLGIEQPPLVAAAQWLVESFQLTKSGSQRLDLAKFIVVTPSRRSQDRLLQLLVTITDDASILFTPPTITTLGHLPEYLYVAEKSLATDLAQQIAWSMALEQTPDEEIKCLTGRTDVADLQDWQPLASMVSKLHSRLANDIWSFSSVAREVKKDTGFLKEESARWDALNSIQQRYYSILYQVDLWDKQAARNYAAAGLLKAGEIRCSTDKQIVMVGTADLNRSVSEMLRQVTASNPKQVSVLVAAPEALNERFDEFGSLVTDAWLEMPIAITDEQLLIVDQPADQAYATSCFLSQLKETSGRDFSADEITIGVPDISIVPQLERSLNSIDVVHRNLAGRPLAETAPVRMMVACREYLHTLNFESLASLVRHPDIFRWVSGQIGSNAWLADLSEFQNAYLPNVIGLDDNSPFGDPKRLAKSFSDDDPGSKRRAKRAAEVATQLNEVHATIAKLVKPLDGDEKPIAEWAQPWSQILVAVYGERLLDKNDTTDRQIIVACDAIYTALGDQRQVPETFEAKSSAIQALDWALEAAVEHRVIQPPIPDAVEMAGWLDLALDDAPVMVVTGMNDENVPTAEIGHQFLPNELCKQLGILDNDRRFARDCYALMLITSVRKDLLLISGRRDDRGEPLKPSRLLFADTDEVAARRAKAFFGYNGKPVSRYWLAPEKDCHPQQQFEIPLAVCSKRINKISVTKFREYIKCPYRFYLQLVLRLQAVSDDLRELDGGKFGDLTHNVMESFGLSDQRDLTDPKKIYEYLNDQLNTFVSQSFGGSRLPAVRIQIEQLRLRFERFAAKQSEHRKSGWRIVSTEEMLEHDFVVDDEPFCINGKIDRVDQHEVTGQIAVWDYKSSDKGAKPEVVHYATRKKEWKDLQLPLYRHLVKEVSVVAGGDFSNVVMGYILLPKKLDDVDFYPASWDAAELNTADEEAKRIIRQLRAGAFWPPNPRPPMYSEDMAAICQDRIFEQFKISADDNGVLEEAAPW